MRCKECKYFEPKRNPKTGRVLPTQDGRCTYTVVYPVLPKSYLVYDVRHRRNVADLPHANAISGEDTDECVTFAPLPEKIKKVKTGNELTVALPLNYPKAY